MFRIIFIILIIPLSVQAQLIDPLGFEKTPQLPRRWRTRYTRGIAPTIAWKSRDALYVGLCSVPGEDS